MKVDKEFAAMALLFLFSFLCAAAFPCNPAHAADFTKKPYIQHTTQHSAIICWEMDGPSTAKIKYGKTKNLEFSADLPVAETFHEVHLKNLEPWTEYYYIVGAGGVKDRGKFKTAPQPGTPFRAIVYGDFRTGPIETTINKKIAKYKPDVFVTVGDYLSDGKNQELWPYLFRTIGSLASLAPYYVSLGNHEKNGPLYFKYFAMPGNERWYSFDYGHAHFIALDSNEPYLSAPEQTEWLTKDIEAARANPNVKFIFPFFHHPPFGTGKRHGTPKVRELWVPIFEKYKVDAVFSGHEHHYERCEVNGITYLVTGGGGASLYEFKYEEPFSVVRAMRFQFMVLDFEPESVKMKSVAMEGDVLDVFTLKAK